MNDGAINGWLASSGRDKDIAIEGGINDLGLLIHEKSDINSISIVGTRCGVMIRAPCNIGTVLIEEFFGDGILVCSSDVTFDYVEIRMRRVGIPYEELHGDGFQFIGIGSDGRPDSTVVLSNIVIKHLVIYTPKIEGLYEGVQGVFGGDCIVEGLVIEKYGIMTDVQEHGITLNTPINCRIGNGVCAPINMPYKVGISLRDRKGYGDGYGNVVSSDAVASFIDIPDGVGIIGCTERKKMKGVFKKTEDKKLSDRLSIKIDIPDTDNVDELIEWSAGYLDVDTISIKTIVSIESANGSGFLKDGRKKILFERHIYTKLLIEHGYDISEVNNPEFINLSPYNNKSNNTHDRYGSLDNQWRRFKIAAEINKDAAIMACSVGLGQVLCKNWEMLGYASPVDMWESCDTSQGQIVAMTLFIEKNDIAKLLRSKKIVEFKKRYNGAASSDWTAKFLKEYSRNLKGSDSVLKPTDSRTTKVIISGSTVAGVGVTAGGLMSSGESNNIAKLVQDGLSAVSDSTGLSEEELIKRSVDIAGKVSDSMTSSDIMMYGLIGVSIAFAVLLYLYLDDNGYFRRGR